MNLPPDGFLSPMMGEWRCQAQLSAPLWFALIQDINRGAVALLTVLAPSRASDRELASAAMFARALQSFEATVILAERGMLADAGSLARNIVESAVFLGGLALIDDFTKRMAASNNAHFFGMAKAIAEQMEGNASPEYLANASELRDLLQNVVAQGHARSGINLRQLAKEVGMDPLYEVVYRSLSGDAAHPSLASIERHFGRNGAGQVEKLLFSPQRDGMEKVLSAAISAFLAALEALGEVFPRDDIRAMINTFNARHHALGSPASSAG